MNLTTDGRLAPAEKTPPLESPAESPASEPCPRCGKSIIDPAGLGWCPGCGYCKSLTDQSAQQLLTEKTGPSLGGVVQASGAISQLPLWFWASLLAIAIGISFAIWADKQLPTGNNLPRATWATATIVAGTCLILLAQCLALVAIAPGESTLGFKDAIVSFKLWGLVVKRLPRQKECLWAALLGLSLIVGGAAFIGGLPHWFSYLPKSLADQEKEKTKAQSGGGTAVVIPVD